MGGALMPQNADAKEPNILMIVCDQFRYDCLTHTGNNIVSTPNIDRLRNSGMQFTNAYTPIPTSCPARQSLLSGAWPEQPNHQGLWNYDITLMPRLFEGKTWTEAIDKQCDYRLGYVGKWHVHPTKSPVEFGFEEYISVGNFNKWKVENKIANRPIHYHQKESPMMGGYVDEPKEENLVYWFKDQVVDMIDRYEKSDSAWHIRLDYSEPHLPCYPIKTFYDKYATRSIPEWGNFRDQLDNKPYIQYQQLLNWGIDEYEWDKWENYMRSYYAIIEQVDDAIGMLLDELEAKGLTEETLIIFTADHGDVAGSHRMLDKHYVMYEEITHVPLIASWKGKIAPNSVCDKFVVHMLDIAATMNDLLDLNFKTSGSSLLPLLKGEEVESWRKYAFSNYNGQQNGLFVQRMIRDQRYKYVWTPTDIDELYDLEKDPYELKNLIYDKSYADILTRLRADLYKDLIERKDPAAGGPSGAKRQLLLQKKR